MREAQFDIDFIDEPWIDEGTPFQLFRLVLWDFSEDDIADLTSWSIEDYKRQWLSELSAILHSRDRGALITAIHDPSKAFQVRTWTMWREKEHILFQSRILFLLEGTQSFDPARVWEHVGEHNTHNEDGQLLSEWSVPLDAVQDFMSKKALV